MKHGSVTMTRDVVPAPRLRRKCSCCGRRSSHYGRGGGVVLASGCEWSMMQWARDPWEYVRMLDRLKTTTPV